MTKAAVQSTVLTCLYILIMYICSPIAIYEFNFARKSKFYHYTCLKFIRFVYVSGVVQYFLYSDMRKITKVLESKDTTVLTILFTIPFNLPVSLKLTLPVNLLVSSKLTLPINLPVTYQPPF